MQVRDLVEECQCASQFSMIRVSEGKYRIGDTKILIFVRVGIPVMESHDIFKNHMKAIRNQRLSNLFVTIVHDRFLRV